MRELSLHILDIAQNSVSANAECLRIALIENLNEDKLVIKIKDDGNGMDSETVEKVVDPFYTSRTTRKVGLGIPLFKFVAEQCNGQFKIKSEIGVGTEIEADFQHSHIDRVPIGNMADTIITIILSNPNMELIYTHKVDDRKFTFNTRDIIKVLGDVPIENIDVINWLRAYLKEGLEEIGVGK